MPNSLSSLPIRPCRSARREVPLVEPIGGSRGPASMRNAGDVGQHDSKKRVAWIDHGRCDLAGSFLPSSTIGELGGEEQPPLHRRNRSSRIHFLDGWIHERKGLLFRCLPAARRTTPLRPGRPRATGIRPTLEGNDSSLPIASMTPSVHPPDLHGFAALIQSSTADADGQAWSARGSGRFNGSRYFLGATARTSGRASWSCSGDRREEIQPPRSAGASWCTW